jgi:penicillin-binding protein 2
MKISPNTVGPELKNIYRFAAFTLAVAVGITSLSARMVYLQLILDQSAYQGSTVIPATETQTLGASRGLIFDASGRPLVKNVVDYIITVTPNALPLDKEQTVAEHLGDILGIDPVLIETKIDSATGSLKQPVKIAEGVDAQVARFISENVDSLPGVSIYQASKRQYLTGALFAQIIGYEGRITKDQYAQLAAQGYGPADVVGQAGIENYYETALRGVPGNQTAALDSIGDPIPGLITPGAETIPGDSLTLNIDTQEQTDAQQALNWGVTAAKVTKGIIIVENPQNGKILAMVSLPSYDDQKFADGISETDFQALLNNPDQPLLNKAVGAQYAPGSTFKLITGTAGLQDGIINTSTKLVSSPFIQVGTFIYYEWNQRGWGPLDIYGGFSYSSDTFFYQLARLVKLDRLTYWADQYGFGKPTQIDLPETATGIVPTNSWKKANKGEQMYEGELMQAGIGQGYDAVTAMQLLNAYCALANGGNVWQPQIVGSVTNGVTGQVTPVQPQLLNHLPASAETLQVMRVASRQVVTSRHTGNLVDLPIKIAGKTGTAEFSVEDAKGRLPYHSWFVGYTEADPQNGDFTQPGSQLAVLAFIYGANTWGNVATEVVKYYMALHYDLIPKYNGHPLTRYLFDSNFPGYIQPYTYKTTNFFGISGRD